jgi:hypothetical protein
MRDSHYELSGRACGTVNSKNSSSPPQSTILNKHSHSDPYAVRGFNRAQYSVRRSTERLTDPMVGAPVDLRTHRGAHNVRFVPALIYESAYSDGVRSILVS